MRCMEIEATYWARQRENHALLREALLLLRFIASKLDTTPPIPTSPPSSKSPTATPSIIPPSSMRRMAEKVMDKMGREAIISVLMWGAGKLAMWALTYVLPAVAGWLMLVRPGVRWLLGW
mgnify:CR=1 FL=1